MAKSGEPPARVPPAADARKAREAAALRENLRRRKQQGRARSQAAPDAPDPPHVSKPGRPVGE